jgi:hypothetical protein
MNIELPLTLTPVDEPPPSTRGGDMGGSKDTLIIPWREVIEQQMEPGQWYLIEVHDRSVQSALVSIRRHNVEAVLRGGVLYAMRPTDWSAE